MVLIGPPMVRLSVCKFSRVQLWFPIPHGVINLSSALLPRVRQYWKKNPRGSPLPGHSYPGGALVYGRHFRPLWVEAAMRKEVYFSLGLGNWVRWGADSGVFGFMHGEGLDFEKMGEGYRWCRR